MGYQREVLGEDFDHLDTNDFQSVLEADENKCVDGEYDQLNPDETRSLLCLDQWVRTQHNGIAVIGRILAVLHCPESGVLYDVQLPLLQAHYGGMTHVVRFASELHAIGCSKLADIKGDQ